jgi:hypothetical protein
MFIASSNLDIGELDVQNEFIQRNLDFNFIFQIGIRKHFLKYGDKITTTSGLKFSPCYSNVIVLVAFRQEFISQIRATLTYMTVIEPSFQNSVAIICVQSNTLGISALKRSLKLWNIKTTAVYLFEITKSVPSFTGNYFYLCFLCKRNKFSINVETPNLLLSDLEFQQDWGQFEILFQSPVSQEDAIRLKYYCNGRHLTLDQLCK